jgi:type VI secretion system protein ImpE
MGPHHEQGGLIDGLKFIPSILKEVGGGSLPASFTFSVFASPYPTFFNSMSHLITQLSAALRQNDLALAMSEVKAAIRLNPAEPELRYLLFDLLAVEGDYEAASRQAVVVSELRPGPEPAPLLLNSLAAAEVQRKLVFEGKLDPTIFGEPEAWLAPAAECLKSAARGDWDRALALSLEAKEGADACRGELNGQPFEWIMDGDSRLGAVIEVILDGRYYWMPQNRLASLKTEIPGSLSHSLWLPASITLQNGAYIHGFLPGRYPVSTSTQIMEKLGKTTGWGEPITGFHCGSGQKLYMTDHNDCAVLEMRQLSFTSPA